MSTDYDDMIKSANIANGKIIKTFKQQVADSVTATISNDLAEDTNTATISISAKDLYGNEMPSFLLYIDESPLQEHSIIHNIYGAEEFVTQDALAGAGLFQTYANGFATNVQVSDTGIASGTVYQHATFGNVQQITLDFSSSASGTSANITLPQIAYSGINKQAMILRYRIHKSANSAISNNISASLEADERWHMLATTVSSPVAPKFTVTSNVVNDSDNTVIEFANYYAYNLDSTQLPKEVKLLLKALLSKDYSAYADIDNDALQYVRLYETTPQFPTVFRTNGEYDIIIATAANTVPGMVETVISTPTNTVSLNNNYVAGYESMTCTALKKAPFNYVLGQQQIIAINGNNATLSSELASGIWHIYYPATINLTGYIISEQYAVNSEGNIQNIPTAKSFSVPINIIVDVRNTAGIMPDNYNFSAYQHRNTYNAVFNAV